MIFCDLNTLSSVRQFNIKFPNRAPVSKPTNLKINRRLKKRGKIKFVLEDIRK